MSYIYICIYASLYLELDILNIDVLPSVLAIF